MDNLQHQRLELKYIVPEPVAVTVRDFVGAYLTLDKFGAGQPDLSYPVHSLYLDSDDLAFYWHTINGNKSRYKLRLRYYDDQPASPVFFEIKHRINAVIWKQRGAVKRDAVDALLAGQLPGPEQLFFEEPAQLEVLEHFCELMQQHHAKPKAHVAYHREAWVSAHDNSTRVTMDRQTRFVFEPATLLRTELHQPLDVFPNSVVLELKFTGRFPDWFKELVRCFNLWQCSAAKYADGVTLLMESGVDIEAPAVAPLPETEERLRLRRQNLKQIHRTNEPVPAP
jgi:SPX domain protein involved in polyphosphate accumulation